jgi:hypothetical protein
MSEVDDVLAELRGRLAALDRPAPERSEPTAEETKTEAELERLRSISLGEFTRPVPDAWLFRDEVMVRVGPFANLPDIDVFAEALAQLPQAPRAVTWGFDGSTAEIKLTASEPLRLVDEDLRHLPFDPRVEEASASTLTLVLESPPKRSQRGEEAPVLPLHLSARRS